MGKCIIMTGGVGGASSDECSSTKAQVLKGVTAVTSDSNDEPVEGTLEVQSVVNFNVAQYSNLTLFGTWALPTKGPWSGIRIMCKQGSYPDHVSDGLLFYEGSSTSTIVKLSSSGTWYFRAWNYITTNYGRIYGKSIDAAANNTEIKGQQVFTSSGTFNVPDKIYSIDVFVVGGGGGGGWGAKNSGSYTGNNGGGGGYTNTQKVNVSPGQTISVTIGNGGTVNNSGSGGASYFGGVSASGGFNAVKNTGGHGGSGGGGGADSQAGGSGGSNGSNGSWAIGPAPGNGQGRTTREFEEDSGALYSGGGGGGAKSTGWGGGVGGAGGGGKGEGTHTAGNPRSSSGSPNTGGGGGGGASPYGGSASFGGSGVVIVRWGY